MQQSRGQWPGLEELDEHERCYEKLGEIDAPLHWGSMREGIEAQRHHFPGISRIPYFFILRTTDDWFIPSRSATSYVERHSRE